MKKELIELIKSVIIAAIAAFLIVTFIIRPVAVDGSSMFPTLHNKDRLFIEKVTYYFRDPVADDIVVFNYPANPKEQFIKRVIAVGGDKLKINNHKVYVNDKLKEEPYIVEEMNAMIDENYKDEIIVPMGTIFVMGDNRNDSRDSRYSDVGFVNLKQLIGKTIVRIFPLNKVGGIK
ncbi:MAG: signal peptidase I [Clostridiaceae bacterium]|nr:signal peptidase I [Clostridiaceae bacterium]